MAKCICSNVGKTTTLGNVIVGYYMKVIESTLPLWCMIKRRFLIESASGSRRPI